MSRIEKLARASPGALLKTGLSRCQLEEFDDNDCMFANVSANDSFGDCAMASDAVPPRKMARATLSDLFMMQLLLELDGLGLRDMACSYQKLRELFRCALRVNRRATWSLEELRCRANERHRTVFPEIAPESRTWCRAIAYPV